MPVIRRIGRRPWRPGREGVGTPASEPRPRPEQGRRSLPPAASGSGRRRSGRVEVGGITPSGRACNERAKHSDGVQPLTSAVCAYERVPGGRRAGDRLAGEGGGRRAGGRGAPGGG